MTLTAYSTPANRFPVKEREFPRYATEAELGAAMLAQAKIDQKGRKKERYDARFAQSGELGGSSQVDTRAIVIAAAAKHETVTIRQLAEETGFSQNQVRIYLHEHPGATFVRRGKNKTMHWTVKA